MKISRKAMKVLLVGAVCIVIPAWSSWAKVCGKHHVTSTKKNALVSDTQLISNGSVRFTHLVYLVAGSSEDVCWISMMPIAQGERWVVKWLT